VEWLTQKAVPFVLVFTKSDKASADEAQANVAIFMEQISAWFEKPPVTFTCSAETGQGRQELLGVIDEAMTAIRAERQATISDESSTTESPQPRAQEIRKK